GIHRRVRTWLIVPQPRGRAPQGRPGDPGGRPVQLPEGVAQEAREGRPWGAAHPACDLARPGAPSPFLGRDDAGSGTRARELLPGRETLCAASSIRGTAAAPGMHLACMTALAAFWTMQGRFHGGPASPSPLPPAPGAEPGPP